MEPEVGYDFVEPLAHESRAKVLISLGRFAHTLFP